MKVANTNSSIIDHTSVFPFADVKPARAVSFKVIPSMHELETLDHYLLFEDLSAAAVATTSSSSSKTTTSVSAEPLVVEWIRATRTMLTEKERAQCINCINWCLKNNKLNLK